MDWSHPDWLNVDSLTKCLQSEGHEARTVQSFKLSAAAPQGSHYGSNIVRIHVDFKENEEADETQTICLVSKSPLAEGGFNDLIDFSKEPRFYYQFLPEAYKLLNKPFAPKSFQLPSPFVVILEDLKPQGYLMIERGKFLDFEHCQKYITSAAALHALSFALNKKNPDLIKLLDGEKWFSRDSKSTKVMSNATRYAIESMANHMPSESRESKLIKACSSSLFDMLVEAYQPDDTFNCLCQSDAWISNMMFKYDDCGNVIDAKILDFQCLTYGSPINDLVYFLWASSNYDVRATRLTELYHYYIEVLNGYLIQLNCSERLTFEYLIQYVQKLSPICLWQVGFFYPGYFRETPPNYHELIPKTCQDTPLLENPFDELYDEDFCTNYLPQYLHLLKLNGVFEFLEAWQN